MPGEVRLRVPLLTQVVQIPFIVLDAALTDMAEGQNSNEELAVAVDLYKGPGAEAQRLTTLCGSHTLSWNVMNVNLDPLGHRYTTHHK